MFIEITDKGLDTKVTINTKCIATITSARDGSTASIVLEDRTVYTTKETYDAVIRQLEKRKAMK